MTLSIYDCKYSLCYITVMDSCGIVGRFTAGISNSRGLSREDIKRTTKKAHTPHYFCGLDSRWNTNGVFRSNHIISSGFILIFCLCSIPVKRLWPECFLTFLSRPSSLRHVAREMSHKNTSCLCSNAILDVLRTHTHTYTQIHLHATFTLLSSWLQERAEEDADKK